MRRIWQGKMWLTQIITGQAFKGIKGKLYPAVSANQSMKGAKLSATFWRGSKDDYKFKDFGDPRTRQPPKASSEKNEESPSQDEGVMSLGDDGDIELLPVGGNPESDDAQSELDVVSTIAQLRQQRRQPTTTREGGPFERRYEYPAFQDVNQREHE